MAHLTRMLVAVVTHVATAQAAGPASRALPVAFATGSTITPTPCPPHPYPRGDGGTVRLVRRTPHVLSLLHSVLHPPPRRLLTAS